MSKAAIKRIRDEMESPYEGVMYENGKPRSGLWCRFRIEDVPFIAEALYASPRPAAADAGVRVTLSRMGWEEQVEGGKLFTATAVFSEPPPWTAEVVWKSEPFTLSLAAKREQTR